MSILGANPHRYRDVKEAISRQLLGTHWLDSASWSSWTGDRDILRETLALDNFAYQVNSPTQQSTRTSALSQDDKSTPVDTDSSLTDPKTKEKTTEALISQLLAHADLVDQPDSRPDELGFRTKEHATETLKRFAARVLYRARQGSDEVLHTLACDLVHGGFSKADADCIVSMAGGDDVRQEVESVEADVQESREGDWALASTCHYA